MKKDKSQFAICVKNKNYPAALELRKLYQVIADETAAKLHQLRVIDESGDDYFYPEEYFVPVRMPLSGGEKWYAGRQAAEGSKTPCIRLRPAEICLLTMRLVCPA
jgi:hypothetical protein